MRVVTFASGSTGNCTLVSDGGCHILIDAGISARRIRENLSACSLTADDLSGILITHEHTDHVSGLKTLVKYHEIPIFAPRTVSNRLACTIAGVDACLREIPVSDTIGIGNLEITAFPTPHDTDESVGYRVEGDAVFALATDMGRVTQAVYDGLCGADCAVIESNHDVEMLRNGPYPFYLKRRILSDNGHLSNEDCSLLVKDLARSGTQGIILGHLSRENNTSALAFAASKPSVEGTGAFLAVAPMAERLTFTFERKKACLA